jgi:hypothetical protein
MQEQFKPNRRQRRLHLQSGPNRNSGQYLGLPPQVIRLTDGRHKLIFHKPKSFLKQS